MASRARTIIMGAYWTEPIARGRRKHLAFAAGEYMIHDLENIGDTVLAYTTVEFMDGANPPLRVPEAVRGKAA
jgi:hypothetical protein